MALDISFVMNVLNGVPFITYQLASIYPYAHQIIITEGAYKMFSHASTPDGHSRDGTLRAIANFPDPEDKIAFIPHEGFWESRLEMCNGFMPAVTGDILWQIDVDEFYLPWAYESVARSFLQDEQLDRVSFRVREFFTSLEYEVVGAAHVSGLSDVRRVHRFHKGDRWSSQRPPTLVDAEGNPKQMRREISAEEMLRKGIFIFHPTTLFEKQTFDKFVFYRKMWSGIEQKDRWLHETWYEFKNPLRLHGTTTYASWIERFEDAYPPYLEQMITDVKNGQYPDIELRDNSDIEIYLRSPQYREDVQMGEALNVLLVSLGKKRLLQALEPLSFVVIRYVRSPFRVTNRYSMSRILSFLWGETLTWIASIVRKARPASG